jgi:PAS domain S-box-containing protein
MTEDVISAKSEALAAENKTLRARIAELEAERSAQESQQTYLSALHDTALTLMKRVDLRETLDTIVRRAADAVGAKDGYIYLLDPGGETMSAGVLAGNFGPENDRKIRRGEGITGQVWQTGSRIVVETYGNYPHRMDVQYPGKDDAVAAFPLKSDDEVIGVFVLTLPEPDVTFTKTQLHMLDGFADLASIALDKVHLNEELQKNKEFIDKVVEAIPDSVFVFDRTQKHSIFSNGHHVDVFGYTTEDFRQTGLDWAVSLIHPKDRAAWSEHFERLGKAADGETLEVTFRVQHKDGDWRWLRAHERVFTRDEHGAVTHTVGLTRDITEQYEMEEALRSSEARFRELFETAPVMVFIYQDDGVHYANPAFERLTGYTPEQILKILGKEPDNPEYAAIVADFASRLQAFTRDGGAPERHELRIFTRDGKERWLDMQYTVIPFDDKPALLGIGMDITERKQSATRESAIGAEKERVRVLSEFVRDVGHDFRTPLATLSTSLYLLERVQPNPEKWLHQIRVMNEQVTHLDRLLEGMLAMSRLDSESQLEMKPVDIAMSLREMIPDIKRLAEAKSQQITFTLHQPSAMMVGDGMILSRALSQILHNAVQYTLEGGQIQASLAVEDDMIVIAVRDDGIGISEQDLPYIFDRFFRVDKSRSVSGVGLGLSIARKAVESHGGRIEVESVPGAGSEFRVYLPLAEA